VVYLILYKNNNSFMLYTLLNEYNMSIGRLEFSVLSDLNLMKQAVCEVCQEKSKSGTKSVYDERMGPSKDKQICVTCEKVRKDCTGHFG